MTIFSFSSTQSGIIRLFSLFLITILSLVLWLNASDYIKNFQAIKAEEIYPLPTPQDTSNFGLHLKRSLDLLSQSTPEHPQNIRILFYGQSITRGSWWQQLTADLKKRYPHAIIEVENLAIGGFSSQLLVLNTLRDLLSFYPDLIIFHVYGDHIQYEKIIQKMRTLTTADIAIQTDHYQKDSDPNRSDQGWTDFMNNHFLPKVAQRYLCELINVRSAWQQYLKDNNYQSSQLLTDNVHLNQQGNWLMAKLIEPYLMSNPKATDDWTEKVKTYEVGQDINFKNGKLTLEFIGNKIDAIVGTGDEINTKVFIDNKRPSEIPNLYIFNRANETSSTDWPWDVAAPFVITRKTLPQVEEWTLLIEKVEPIQQGKETKLKFTFSLTGSKTGPDGKGTNTEKFISNSGRVIIDPSHWISSFNNPYPSLIKPGYKLNFQSVLLGTDIYQPPKIKDNTHELSITLAQGLKNEKHRLELVADRVGNVPIKAIRVYRPPLTEAQIKRPLVAEEVTPSLKDNNN